jgi:hypothetical protein
VIGLGEREDRGILRTSLILNDGEDVVSPERSPLTTPKSQLSSARKRND